MLPYLYNWRINMNPKIKRIEQLEKSLQTNTDLREESQEFCSDFIKKSKKYLNNDPDNKDLYQSILTKVRNYQRKLLKSPHSISAEWFDDLFKTFSEAELRLLAQWGD